MVKGREEYPLVQNFKSSNLQISNLQIFKSRISDASLLALH